MYPRFSALLLSWHKDESSTSSWTADNARAVSVLKFVTWQERVTWLNVLFCFSEQIMLHGSFNVTCQCYDTWQLSCITWWNCSHVSHSFFGEAICFFWEAINTLESNWALRYVCSWSVTYKTLSCSNENIFPFQLFKLFMGLICGLF